MEAMMHSNGSALAVAQRLNSKPHPLMGSPSRKAAGPPLRSAVGFLLLDSSLHPIAFNVEAIRVLSYPDQLATVRPADVFLAERIRETLLDRAPSRESTLVTEVAAGRRRSLSPAFGLDSAAKSSSHASIALLL